MDRVVANGDFMQIFDDCTVENIITTTSDHYAILVTIARRDEKVRNEPIQQSFKFEAAWMRASDYDHMIEEYWKVHKGGITSIDNTWSALNKLSCSLQEWSRVSFGSVKKEIRKLEKRLTSIRRNNIVSNNSDEERDIKKRLSELFEREEIMARQQSRVEWLREGDRNTSFFHARASARRRNNIIKFLRKVDGSRCEDSEGIKGMVYDFYTSLFTSEPSVSIDAVLEAIPKKFTKQINEALCREYTNDEIKAASKWDLLRPQA